MSRETRFHNVNVRFAQAATSKQPKRYGSNEVTPGLNRQLLQKISEIRGLEDQLLALQYQRQLLIEQNNIYKDALEKLKRNNEIQEGEICRLEEEAEMHRLKNQQLAKCDENLRSLYEEINALTELAQKRHRECELLQQETNKLVESNQVLAVKKKELIERKSLFDVKIEEYFHTCEAYLDDEIDPIGNLRIRLQRLLQSRQRLKMEEEKIKRQNKQALRNQHQHVIKLEYEQELLKQRLLDAEKNEEIAKICQTQQNLDGIVEDMLMKEDQLVEELKRLELQYEDDEKNLQDTMQKLQDDWAQQKQAYYREIRQLKAIHCKTSFETEQLQLEVKEQQERQRKIAVQYELICKLKLNLSSMQRLREVEERNNYLRLKIKQQNDIKELLIQQKQLNTSSRATEVKALTSHYHSTFDFDQSLQ